MTNYAALVEGHTEKQFFERTLPKVKAVKSIINGSTKEVLIESIVVGFRTLQHKYNEVFIIFDRERLNDSGKNLAGEVLLAIAPFIGDRKVFVGVPDRELEVWILADPDCHKTDYIFDYEGTEPKKTCERILDAQSPEEKARIFKKCFASRIAKNSPSFNEFYSSYNGNWYWMLR